MTKNRRKLTWLGIAFGVLTVVLIYTGRPLMTPASPLGIVSFQLAFGAPRAQSVLAAWDPPAREMAWLNLALDFPYLVLYAAILSLLCRMASSASIGAMAQIGMWLSRYVWFAALFDVIENGALLYQLSVTASAAAALVAGIAATAKFAVIASVLIYLIAITGLRWRPR